MEAFLSYLATAWYVVVCIFLFSASIAIHEFGHFLAAKKLGYRVERFSIGFGRAIWKTVRGGVEYRIGWIPFGGYVSIPDVDPEGTKKLEGEKGGDTPRKQMPPWKDLVVAFAGPAMNIVFAFALATLLYFVPQARFGTIGTEVGDVFVDSPADKAGMRAGDVIVAIGSRDVETWTDVTTETQFAAGRETVYRVRRGGETLDLLVSPARAENGAAYIGALSVTNDAARCAMWMPERGIAAQVLWDAGAVFRALKGLVTPREMKATGRALGGPVLIAKGTYATIRRDTWDGLGFLRFVNTNLAVMNLLPIPVLDGGLILFSLLAIVFRRRVPDKIVEPVTTVFMYILVGLMLFLVGRDFWRIGTGSFSKPLDPGVLRSEAASAHDAGGADAP